MPIHGYRISRAGYPLFGGTGAAQFGGRWNSPGREVIYCADSYAGALLEILVHANIGRLPGRHRCVVIEVPDSVEVETVDAGTLSDWDADDQLASRAFGDRWLVEQRTAALLVPSIVAGPFGRNLLINPVHPDASRLGIGAPVEVVWDLRLFRPSV